MLKINLNRKKNINFLETPTSLNHSQNITWQRELKDAIKNFYDLETVLETKLLTDQQRQIIKNETETFPIFITQRMAIKIKQKGPNSALWKQFVPNITSETDSITNQSFFKDPIGDIDKHITNQIIHRYHNRALFLPNINCPIHCRFCFRQHNLDNSSHLFNSDLDKTMLYLNQNPQIEELIFSGGDPLLINDDKLFSYFEIFKKSTNVKYIRLHSKAITTLPSRFTTQTLDMLSAASKMYDKFQIILHCNHLDELGTEEELIIYKLKKRNISLRLQSVLLKGINNNHQTLKKLFVKFSTLGVDPYYLHHPDRVKNASHFYLSIEEGRSIYAKLRNITPGWAIPHYVVDLPQARGKSLVMGGDTYNFSGNFMDKDGISCSY